MATPSTGNTAASALPAAGGTSESTISNWAGPYITNMLGKAQAVANEPYHVYQGPMTAGESGLQSKVFQGLGNLSFPGNLGQSFASPMGGAVSPMGGPPMPMGNQMDPGAAYRSTGMPMEGGILGAAQTDTAQTGMPPQGGIAGLQPPQTSQQPSNIAQSYMNPYLQSVLNPQMDELRRQNAITNMQANAKLTGAGAFGGGRQAIMNAENNRNLMQEMNKTVGQGYASAYDKAMGQFNTEQGQSKDLVNMLANAGQAQRGIEQEGITADYNEFLAQRDDPMKKTQYLQSMLQGLPYQTVTNMPLPKSGMGQLAEITGSLPGVEETLKNLGLI
jgi:hypothetical protein